MSDANALPLGEGTARYDQPSECSGTDSNSPCSGPGPHSSSATKQTSSTAPSLVASASTAVAAAPIHINRHAATAARDSAPNGMASPHHSRVLAVHNNDPALSAFSAPSVANGNPSFSGTYPNSPPSSGSHAPGDSNSPAADKRIARNNSSTRQDAGNSSIARQGSSPVRGTLRLFRRGPEPKDNAGGDKVDAKKRSEAGTGKDSASASSPKAHGQGGSVQSDSESRGGIKSRSQSQRFAATQPPSLSESGVESPSEDDSLSRRDSGAFSLPQRLCFMCTHRSTVVDP